METAIGPEEPLFYIGLLIVLCYFIYLVIMNSRQKANRQQKIKLLDIEILNAEKQFENTSLLLKNELSKYYSSEWVDASLNGYILKDMPEVLLKVAIGSPNDVNFNGPHGKVWKYGYNGGSKLVVNIWNNRVSTWHHFN